MKKIVFSCFLFLSSCFCFAQNKNTASPWSVYNDKAEADTNRVKALYTIAWGYTTTNADSSLKLAQILLQLAQATKQEIYEGKALNTMGVSYFNKGNFPKAMEFYLKTLKFREGLRLPNGKLKDIKGIGMCYNNIANIYAVESNNLKALEHYSKALQLFEELGDKKAMGMEYNNIGNIFLKQSKADKALEYELKELKISEELGDERMIGASYNNLGLVYKNLKKYDLSLEYFDRALKIKKEIEDKEGIGTCYLNMAMLYNEMGKFNLALKYANLALPIASEIKDLDFVRMVYQNFASAYSGQGNYKQAFEYHVKFKQLTDSLFNINNSKELGGLKTRFEVEKKEAELKAKADAQEIINAVEKKRQQSVIYSVMGLLVIVFVFALFMFNRFRVMQKQKHIIEKQKHLVEEKQKEILDSIP